MAAGHDLRAGENPQVVFAGQRPDVAEFLIRIFRIVNRERSAALSGSGAGIGGQRFEIGSED